MSGYTKKGALISTKVVNKDCKGVHNSNYKGVHMKKKRLKAIVQDMLIVSFMCKFAFLCMLADFVVSKTTLLILAYVVISMMLEVHLLSKYELRPSMFCGGNK